MRKIINEKNLCKSVKSVGLKQSMRKNLRHLRNLHDKNKGAHFWREPLASGQISAEIRE